MNRLTRLMHLAVLLALVSAFVWTPAAEAAFGCSVTYCAGQPSSKVCACPAHSDIPGRTASCGSWTRVGVCWYGSAAAAATPVAASDTDFLATLADSQGNVPNVPDIEILAPNPKLASTSCTTHSQCPTGQLCCYPCGIYGCDIKLCTTPERGRCPMYP